MVRFIMAALAVIGALTLPSAALAVTDGFTTADVNMRAGPSTEYPRIIVLPRGAPIVVYGCVRGYSWCDVSYYQERGWVSSRYLNIFYDDRRLYVPYTPRVQVPIITFDFGYWDRYYPRYSWYRDYRWRRTYPGPDYWRERRRNDDVILYPPDRRRNDRYEGRNDRTERAPIVRERRPSDRAETLRPRRNNDNVKRERRRDVEPKRERRRDVEPKREKPRKESRPRNDNPSGRASDCVMRNGKCVPIN